MSKLMFQYKKMQVLCVMLFLSAHMSFASSLDLSENEFDSMMGLVTRVSLRAKANPQIKSVAEKETIDYEKFQLAYTIIYLVENGIVGERLAKIFEAMQEELDDVKIPNYITFYDKYEEMTIKLAADALKKYGANSNIVFNSTPIDILARQRSFSVLVAQAQGRITRKTGYKFKEFQTIFDHE